jgi:hypothetical protein
MQVPEGIEDEARTGQQNVLPAPAEGQAGKQENGREKAEQKNGRAEYQTASSLPCQNQTTTKYYSIFRAF